MFPVLTIDSERPLDVDLQPGVNAVYTFRRSIENRARKRMNKLRDRLRTEGYYRRINRFYQVKQDSSSGNSVAFSVVNTNRAAQFLLAPGGTRPHTIIQRPHMIPRFALDVWLVKGGSTGQAPPGRSVQSTSAHVQQILARRPIIIPHPGTEPDVPAQRAIDQEEPIIIQSLADATDYWASHFGRQIAGEDD